jgi:hypothetical protein
MNQPPTNQWRLGKVQRVWSSAIRIIVINYTPSNNHQSESYKAQKVANRPSQHVHCKCNIFRYSRTTLGFNQQLPFRAESPMPKRPSCPYTQELNGSGWLALWEFDRVTRARDSVTHHLLDWKRSVLGLTMTPTLVANGDIAAGKPASAPVAGRVASVYSEVQTSRIDHALPLPSVLRSSFNIVDGPASTAAGNPGISCPLNSHSDPRVFVDKSALVLLFGFWKNSRKRERKWSFEFVFRAFFWFSVNSKTLGF